MNIKKRIDGELVTPRIKDKVIFYIMLFLMHILYPQAKQRHFTMDLEYKDE